MSIKTQADTHGQMAKQSDRNMASLSMATRHSIATGNATAAYIYSRMAAREALGWQRYTGPNATVRAQASPQPQPFWLADFLSF